MTEVFVEINGHDAYIAVPDAGASRALMAIHGSGRNHRSYRDPSVDTEGVAFYQAQRDVALGLGLLFCVVNNNRDANGNLTRLEWGLDAGLANLEALQAHVVGEYGVDPAFDLWATSAGGSLAHRFASDNRSSVRKVVGTFPVYDLEDMFDRNENCAAAWGSKESIGSANPPTFIANLLDLPMLIYHGTADTVVPAEQHSIALAADMVGNPRFDLHLVPGGHSTTNWNVLPVDSISAWLADDTPEAGQVLLQASLDPRQPPRAALTSPTGELRVMTPAGAQGVELVEPDKSAIHVQTAAGVRGIAVV